jgi:hypothetical protein
MNAQISSYPPDSNSYLLMNYISYSLGRKTNARDSARHTERLTSCASCVFVWLTIFRQFSKKSADDAINVCDFENFRGLGG